MGLIWFGSGAFVVGVAMILGGDRIRARAKGAGPEEPFLKWFMKVVKKAFAILTDPEAGPGQKVAAAGTVIAAAGLLAFVVGLVTQLG